ncbi:hypothetical protein BO71DRAFT_321582, partial [Aspergillus ellipticus CBS 707.79]
VESRLADVQCRGFSRHRAVLSSICVLPSMNPKDLLRYLSKPAKYVIYIPPLRRIAQILSSARPDTFAGIGIFRARVTSR